MGTYPKSGQSGYPAPPGSVILPTWTHKPSRITEPSIWVLLEALFLLGLLSVRMLLRGELLAVENLLEGEAGMEQGGADS